MLSISRELQIPAMWLLVADEKLLFFSIKSLLNTPILCYGLLKKLTSEIKEFSEFSKNMVDGLVRLNALLFEIVTLFDRKISLEILALITAEYCARKLLIEVLSLIVSVAFSSK